MAQHFMLGIMRALITACVLLVCASVRAVQPEYFSSCRWVEQQCGTNMTPKDECVYVGRIEPHKYAAIIHFHTGMTLREIIDQTPFKGTAVTVHVLRAKRPISMYYFRVGASEQPDYQIKNQDMIWLYEDGPVIQT
jgi:hypothetical protein